MVLERGLAARWWGYLHVDWGRTGFEVIGPGSWKEIKVKLGWKVYRNNLIVKDGLKEGTWTLLR